MRVVPADMLPLRPRLNKQSFASSPAPVAGCGGMPHARAAAECGARPKTAARARVALRRGCFTAALMVFTTLVVVDARASQEECVAWRAPEIFPNRSGQNLFRINHSKFTEHLGMSAVATNAAVGLVAAQWNNNANAGWFRYAGSTEVVLPEDEWGPNCEALAGSNLVVAWDGSDHDICEPGGWWWWPIPPPLGFAGAPFCQEGPEGLAGRIWVLGVCAGHNWSHWGVPASTQYDVLSTLTHEFGHALNLYHYPGGV